MMKCKNNQAAAVVHDAHLVAVRVKEDGIHLEEAANVATYLAATATHNQ